MLFDVIAVIIGISYTLRRLSLAKLELPLGAPPQLEFEPWKASQLAAYRLGATVCFGKVVLGVGFLFVMRRLGVDDANWGKRGVSMAIDVMWVVGLALAMRRSAQARARRRTLGLPEVFSV